MARPATRIVLSEEERKQLEAMRTRPKAQNRYAERARIILSAAQGCSNKEIARALNTREARISKWRVRFEREGLSGLHDDFRAGRPVEVMENFRELLLARLDEDPPEGFARWNGRLLAKSLGQSADRVWRELGRIWRPLPASRRSAARRHQGQTHDGTEAPLNGKDQHPAQAVYVVGPGAVQGLATGDVTLDLKGTVRRASVPAPRPRRC